MFITSNKIVVFLGLFIVGIFFLTTESVLIAELFLAAAFIAIVYDRVSNWLSRGAEDAKKIDGYFPQDKLLEYYGHASKKTAEVIGPDRKTPLDYKGMGHRSPNMAKSFFSELDKIFK